MARPRVPLLPFLSLLSLQPLVFLVLLLAAAAPAAATGSDPLHGLRTALSAHLEAERRDPAESRRLADWLRQAEATAAHEPDGALREKLGHELAGLRDQLAAAARPAAEPGGEAVAPARIAGTVFAAATGGPVQYVDVALYDASGAYRDIASTGSPGAYAFADLAPGTYFLTAQHNDDSSQTLASELWRGLPCRPSGCAATTGTPVTLAAGQTFEADFHLEERGKVTGTVRAAESGLPLAGRQVRLHGLAGDSFAAGFTGADGRYSIAGIPNGRYYAAVTDSADRPGMVHPGQVCQTGAYAYSLACDLTSATPIEVEDGETLAGLDFALAPGASITGRVIADGTVSTLASATIYLEAAGSPATFTATTGADGVYRFDGLAAGSWRLKAARPSFTPQAFHLHNCLTIELCPPAAFDPVITAPGEVTSGVDFSLRLFGRLHGRVIDAVRNVPMDGATVVAFAPDGTFLASSSPSGFDGFYTFLGLPEGEMVFRAQRDGYQPEFFRDVPPWAGPAAATRVAIQGNGFDNSGVDFSLLQFGGMLGRAVDRETGAPLEGCDVYARNLDVPPPAGAGAGHCTVDGFFQVYGLWPGRYRVWIVPHGEHAPYLLGAGSCNLLAGTPPEPNCDLSLATQLEVPSINPVEVGELRLEKPVTISGNVQLQTAPNPRGPVVRVYDAGGREVRSQPISLDDQDYGFPGLAPGTYRVVLDGNGAYVSKPWNSAACNRWYCDPNLAQSITLIGGESRSGVDFQSVPLAPYTGCTESATAICLQQGRFKVETTWHDFIGQSGPGQAVRVTGETAYFWFFDPGNVELMVKALNGCRPDLGSHFWIFAAGLTNVEVELKVTDTLTGAFKTYGNPSGQVIAPLLDIGAFETCGAPEPAAVAESPLLAAGIPRPAELSRDPASNCDETAETLCLAGGRFQVDVSYQTRDGDPFLPAHARHLTGDTGAFHFYSEDNIELMVKVLEACDQQIPGYWIFAAGLTDVRVDLQVLDTQTGQQKTYAGQFGPYPSVFDLGTFAASCD